MSAVSTTAPAEGGTRGSPAGGEFVIRRIRDMAAGDEYATAWDSLAETAIEPNPYYERWMLLPALQAVGGGSTLEFVLVFRHDRSNVKAAPLLCGFFPLERYRRYRGLPVKTLRLCQHIYCSLGTPLLRQDYAPQTLEAFLDWLASRDSDCTLVEFPMLVGGGPCHQLLIEALFSCRWLSLVTQQYTRALYRCGEEPSQYLAAMLSGKKRKHLRRQQELLSGLGRLEYAQLEDRSDLGVWVEEFLCLEASGWKGRAGTALATVESHRCFFESMAEEGFRRNRLLLSALRLDGQMIAGRAAVRAGSGSYLLKIAYDENYAKFSPGILLELEVIKHSARSVAEWTDSSTAPENALYKMLWRERRVIESRLVAPGRAPGGLVLSALPLLSWGKRTLRRLHQRRPSGAVVAGKRRAVLEGT